MSLLSEAGIPIIAKATCPRRILEAPLDKKGELLDGWDLAGECSYCGSVSPGVLFARLNAGNVIVTPTDKNYKIYLDATPGSPLFRRQFRTDNDSSGDPTKWVWGSAEVPTVKFYFQHLTLEQREQFIALYNDKKMQMAYPHQFYVTPYFADELPESR